MSKIREYDDEERGCIFESISEMREHFPGVLVAPDALSEPEPGWQAGDN